MTAPKAEQLGEIEGLYHELVRLSNRRGVSEDKLSRSPVLLGLAAHSRPTASTAELVVEARSLIEHAVSSTASPRNRNLLYQGLNLGEGPLQASNERINEAWATMGPDLFGELKPESALDKFRNDLLVQLAWRISGLSRPSPPETRVELAIRLQNQGRWQQADDALYHVVYGADDSRDQKIEAWRLLALSRWEQRDFPQVLSDVESAVSLCEPSDDVRELTRTIDRLGVRFTDIEEFDLAKQMVRNALGHLHANGDLWQRLACIQWYEGDYLTSLSSFSSALEGGKPRPRVVHARGQVLAEMGAYRDAIAELDEALSTPRSSNSEAYARSSRAYAIGMLGDIDLALSEFALAEAATPNNAWLHYFKGLCYYQFEMTDKALTSLQESLLLNAPSLNRPKRERALKVIGLLEQAGG